MTGDYEQHEDWCEEHDDKRGCATDWVGVTDSDRDTEVSVRTLQRPGEDPVVQLSLRSGTHEVVADFAPFGWSGSGIGGFSDLLAGEVQMAFDAHNEARTRQVREG